MEGAPSVTPSLRSGAPPPPYQRGTKVQGAIILHSLSALTKTFANGMAALGPLDLNVGVGEFVSLVGPSGCGKSTALRVIAGLLAPSTGVVEFPDGRPEIGFVFQEPTLMPWASALENARLPLDLKHMNRSEADARAANRACRASAFPVSSAPIPASFRAG